MKVRQLIDVYSINSPSTTIQFFSAKIFFKTKDDAEDYLKSNNLYLPIDVVKAFQGSNHGENPDPNSYSLFLPIELKRSHKKSKDLILDDSLKFEFKHKMDKRKLDFVKISQEAVEAIHKNEGSVVRLSLYGAGISSGSKHDRTIRNYEFNYESDLFDLYHYFYVNPETKKVFIIQENDFRFTTSLQNKLSANNDGEKIEPTQIGPKI